MGVKISTGKVKSAYRGGLIPLQGTWHIPTGDTACTGRGLAMKRPDRLGSASKPASRRVNTRQSVTPNQPVDGSIPASRPRRRQAGIRSASGESLLPLRRFPWRPYQPVLRRNAVRQSYEHFSSMGTPWKPLKPLCK